MGNKPTISKSAEKRIKGSKFAHKMMEYSEAYGRLSGSALQKWVDENYSDQITSVTYCTFKKPSYRKSKKDTVDTFQRAYEKDWRIKIIQIVDVTTNQDKQIIDSIYRFTCPNPSYFFKKTELFYQFHGQIDINSGKWVKTQHKQYVDQSVVSIKYRDVSPVQRHVRTSPQQQTYSSSNSQSYSSNQYSSNQYSSNNATEENRRREERQRREREERSRKENEDRQRRERQAAERYRRQQQQAAERDKRYRQQQQRHRQNMRRQEQAQREYRRQQQQQAEQRQRQYMTALSKRR